MLFTSDRIVHGHSTHQYDKPEWGPLLQLAPGHIDDFILREVLRRRGE